MRYLIITLIFLSGCVVITTNDEQKTQLEIREFQTRYFQVNDKNIIIKAVVNALLDEGYIIQNANTDIGFITAQKGYDISEDYSSTVIYRRKWKNKNYYETYEKNKIIETTINISEFSNGYKVRAVFQYKIYDNKGNLVEIEQIDDEDFYQEFFSKIDKSIFLQKELENK